MRVEMARRGSYLNTHSSSANSARDDPARRCNEEGMQPLKDPIHAGGFRKRIGATAIEQLSDGWPPRKRLDRDFLACPKDAVPGYFVHFAGLGRRNGEQHGLPAGWNSINSTRIPSGSYRLNCHLPSRPIWA